MRALLLTLLLTGCAAGRDQAATDQEKITDYGLDPLATEWQAGVQPRPGAIIRVTRREDGTMIGQSLADFGDRLTPQPAAAFDQDTRIATKLNLSLALSFLAKLIPSASLGVNSVVTVERKAAGTSAMAIPNRPDMIDLIGQAEAGAKSAGLASTLASVRSQQVTRHYAGGDLYLVTAVARAGSLTWQLTRNRSASADLKAGQDKVATGEVKGEASFDGATTATYTGTPRVYSVHLARIGNDGGIIRYNPDLKGPRVLFGD